MSAVVKTSKATAVVTIKREDDEEDSATAAAAAASMTEEEYLDDQDKIVVKNESVMLPQVSDENDDDAATAVRHSSGGDQVSEATVTEEEVATVVEEEEEVPTDIVIQEEVVATGDSGESQPQIYIIQTTDGSMPMETAEVVVADDSVQVYETVSALEQLSRGQVLTTADGGEVIQVYEEVVLEGGSGTTGGNSAGIIDQFVDVAEVEVGDGRSASPIKVETVSARLRAGGSDSPGGGPAAALAAAAATGTEFHICRLCNQFVPLGEVANHNRVNHSNVSDLTCIDCGKLFKSKRSLFGHRKEKHSGVTEVHHCPECGKSFGRKSNLKAHRESLHYGKKFPCSLCERIFTNRSSMNQHIKKTHGTIAGSDTTSFVVQQ